PLLGELGTYLVGLRVDDDELVEEHVAAPLTFGLIGQERVDRLRLAQGADDDLAALPRLAFLAARAGVRFGRVALVLAAFVRFGGLLVATFVGLGGFLFFVALVGRFGRRRLGAAAVGALVVVIIVVAAGGQDRGDHGTREAHGHSPANELSPAQMIRADPLDESVDPLLAVQLGHRSPP